jgi:hypothetical protein
MDADNLKEIAKGLHHRRRAMTAVLFDFATDAGHAPR